MVKFIKNFGLGLLYFIALPLLILGVVCYAVYGLGIYIFYLFKGTIRFFKGDTFFEELPEDAKVKEIKKKLQDQATNPEHTQAAPAPVNTTSNVSNQDNSQQSTYNVTNNYYGNPQPNMNQGSGPQFRNPNPRIDMDATEVDTTYMNSSNNELKEPTFDQLETHDQKMIDNKQDQIESLDLWTLEDED